MSDYSKTDPLLTKDTNSAVGNAGLNRNYTPRFSKTNYNANEEWWVGESGSSNSSESFSQSDQGNKAVWEDHVTSQGDLFYLEYHRGGDSQSVKVEREQNEKTDAFEKSNSNGFLVRLIRRRSSRRSFRKKGENEDGVRMRDEEKSSSRAKKLDNSSSRIKGVDCRLVTIRVDPENTYNLSRRATLIETLLGLLTVNDDSRIIISGFVSNFSEQYQQQIMIGDWLHSIDGRVITHDNIEDYLSSITSSREVTLKLLNKIEEYSDYASATDPSFENSYEKNFGVLYAKLDGFTEDGPSDQGIIYSYPHLDNSLFLNKGAFFTLHQLAPEVVSAHPASTTVRIKDDLYHVIYTHEGKELLLIASPQERCTQAEALRASSDAVRCLCFMYQSLSNCFSNPANKSSLDEFFKKYFSSLNCFELKKNVPYFRELDYIWPATNWLSLPKEVEVHINDALNELEANDIGSHESQRLFTIIGSCFYHKGFMVCSHLGKEDLVDVSSFCRQYGLLSSTSEGLQLLVIWKEVFPMSCQRGFTSYSTQIYSVPHGRWFLLIVGQDHDMLVVLLESGGCTARLDGISGPEPLYVEEAQATLEHIQKLGISRYTSKRLGGNVSGVSALSESTRHNHEQESLAHSIGSSNSQYITPTKAYEFTDRNKVGNEVDSAILGFLEGDDEAYIQNVESDPAETGPILGRRAEREKASEAHCQSFISESDVSDDSDWMRDKKSYYSDNLELDFGIKLSITDSLLPVGLLTGGDQLFFHFIHLDSAEGILMSSLNKSSYLNNQSILDNFKRYSQHIHSILMNTVSFKKIKVQDFSANTVNKSLVAIKEHGILFQSGSDSKDNSEPITYWIIGRLFFIPHPREVYVCYPDSCPQNVVEIAFRLALSAAT